jgi:hypothetical protein
MVCCYIALFFETLFRAQMRIPMFLPDSVPLLDNSVRTNVLKFFFLPYLPSKSKCPFLEFPYHRSLSYKSSSRPS